MILLTGLLALITAVYAWLTYRILQVSQEAVRVSRDSVSAMQQQTESLYRPYVTVSTFSAPIDRTLFLRILNSGQTAAEHLHLSIDRGFAVGRGQSSEVNLQDAGAFRHPIQSFPPGAELVFLLGDHDQLFGREGAGEHPDSPWRFNVVAEYTFLGKRTVESSVIDLRQYELTIPPPDAVSLELRKLRNAVAEGFRRASK